MVRSDVRNEMKLKPVIAIEIVVAVLAVLATLWAALAVNVTARGNPMLFVDVLMPKRSFDAYLHETAEPLKDDILTAHQRGVQLVRTPLVAATALWLVAFLIAAGIQLTRKNKIANSERLSVPRSRD